MPKNDKVFLIEKIMDNVKMRVRNWNKNIKVFIIGWIPKRQNNEHYF